MSQDQDKPDRSERNSDVSNGSEDDQQDTLDNPKQSVRKKVRQNTPSPSRGNMPQASPPQFVSVKELMETAKGVTNMVLAHEIVVNGGFQIKQAELPENSLEKRVREIVHKAFWDCLEAQLKEDPPLYDHAIKLVGEIKEALLTFLLPGHTRLRNQITETLDLELIKQEAENGALDISKLAEFIIGMMGTLCAPARDEEIKKLKEIHEIVSLFRAIFSVLDLMKMDMANFAVSSIRPHLMQQSVEYERKKFQELYEKQPNSLAFVTEWLQEAADEVRPKTLPAIGDGTSHRPPVLCPLAVQNHAYLKLLKWDHLRKPFPETVLMDQTRFQEMQFELDQLMLTGAVLLVTFNAAGPALSGLPGFADKLKTAIRVLLTGLHLPSFNLTEALAAISEKVCAEVNNCLSQHGFTPFTPEKEAVLKGQIQSLVNPDNSICKLIDSRSQVFLGSYLASGYQKPIPAIPGGLGPIQQELEEIAVKYIRLVNYNKMVFSPYYDAVLSNILNKEETAHLQGKLDDD
ncbi:T-complex protein 11-like protein 1 [Sphaerodactylus townsendi]|uniref:T-complex protein 11-like protein 1 n=1 Tax=Sphaerodactylus townsendi TaxID=933632 RepID=UPI002025EBFC|nr:T-complex protein 11-like protein 1 [Sphaerodactylus townsendi]XP_048340959.1 T-complex protein 11-like protein 1 [Sphaerodactylus townsendi]